MELHHLLLLYSQQVIRRRNPQPLHLYNRLPSLRRVLVGVALVYRRPSHRLRLLLSPPLSPLRHHLNNQEVRHRLNRQYSPRHSHQMFRVCNPLLHHLDNQQVHHPHTRLEEVLVNLQRSHPPIHLCCPRLNPLRNRQPLPVADRRRSRPHCRHARHLLDRAFNRLCSQAQYPQRIRLCNQRSCHHLNLQTPQVANRQRTRLHSLPPSHRIFPTANQVQCHLCSPQFSPPCSHLSNPQHGLQHNRVTNPLFTLAHSPVRSPVNNQLVCLLFSPRYSPLHSQVRSRLRIQVINQVCSPHRYRRYIPQRSQVFNLLCSQVFNPKHNLPMHPRHNRVLSPLFNHLGSPAYSLSSNRVLSLR